MRRPAGGWTEAAIDRAWRAAVRMLEEVKGTEAERYAKSVLDALREIKGSPGLRS